MTKFAEFLGGAVLIIGGIILIIGGIILLLPLSTLCGAIAGWAVGLFFEKEILSVASQLGVHNVTMWQLGAFLGFVGAFLRTTTTVKEK